MLFKLNYSTRLGSLFSGGIKVYSNAVVFEQHFASGYAHWVSWFYESDGTSSTIGRVEDHVSRRTLVAPGFSSPQFGQWNENLNMTGGIGGSGVVSVFDSLSTAVVLSPLTNPMAVSHVCGQTGQLAYGIMGNVTEIPRDFSVQVVMYVSTEGVNQAVTQWGQLMRSYYDKYLGYTTDNGAYYYYHTEPGQDYEQTLVAVKKYADSLSIPYKYVLLDSWWYYKGSNGGVANWTALPEVFPNGVEALWNQTGWFVQAHNRYWSLDNHYTSSTGGEYTFIEDPVKDGAVPNDERFWGDIFATPAAKWGLKVYEQDWLFNEYYQYVSQFMESVSLGRQWLLQMGRGATKHGLTIQYCMPFIRHLLQSLEVSSVTQARASDDYVVSPYVGVDNWRIGGQSLLIDALGLAPSKDGYWSVGYQANNPYGEDRFEPYPRLQAAVTALSAGPVAIADGIGFMDAELIMKSCAKNGRLLQPSSPAAMIDLEFKQRAIGGNLGPQGEVWFAPSHLHTSFASHSTLRFGSLFVADLSAEFYLRPSDVGYAEDVALYAREANQTVGVQWSASNPLLLKPCGFSDFSLYTVSPIDRSSGLAFLGEVNKWVGVSSARFSEVVLEEVRDENEDVGGASFAIVVGENKTKHLSVTATGSNEEVLTVQFLTPSGDVKQVVCTVGVSEKVVIRSDGKDTCKAGEFYVVDGVNNHCQSCIGHSSSATEGADSCTCNAGYAQSGTGTGLTCTVCPDGAYSLAGDATCTSCSAGTISTSPVSGTCTTCAAGRFSTAGASVCSTCPAGQYSAANSETCSMCTAGSASVAGSDQCTACTAGQYSLAGAPVCLSCAAGTVSATDSSTSCAVCPAGQFATGTEQTVCSNCPIGQYSAQEKSGTCTSCQSGFTTPSVGTALAGSCVSPIPNFTIGFIALGVVVGMFAIYIVAGRFHLVAFNRRENIVLPLALTCIEMNESLKTMIKNRRVKTAVVIASKLKVLCFFLFCLAYILGYAAFTYIALMYKVLFTTLILWRGLDFAPPLIRSLQHALEDFAISFHFPFDYVYALAYPIVWVYRKLSNLQINLDAVSVTCEGAKAPIELFINCLIMGFVVIFIRSDYQMLLNVTLPGLNQSFLTNNIVKGNIWHRNIFFCLCVMTVNSLNPFQIALQYCMNYVNITKFGKRYYVTHDVTQSCDHIPGAQMLDSFLGDTSSIFAWWLVLPALYIMSEVLVPRIVDKEQVKGELIEDEEEEGADEESAVTIKKNHSGLSDYSDTDSECEEEKEEEKDEEEEDQTPRNTALNSDGRRGQLRLTKSRSRYGFHNSVSELDDQSEPTTPATPATPQSNTASKFNTNSHRKQLAIRAPDEVDTAVGLTSHLSESVLTRSVTPTSNKAPRAPLKRQQSMKSISKTRSVRLPDGTTAVLPLSVPLDSEKQDTDTTSTAPPTRTWNEYFTVSDENRLPYLYFRASLRKIHSYGSRLVPSDLWIVGIATKWVGYLQRVNEKEIDYRRGRVLWQYRKSENKENMRDYPVLPRREEDNHYSAFYNSVYEFQNSFEQHEIITMMSIKHAKKVKHSKLSLTSKAIKSVKNKATKLTNSVVVYEARKVENSSELRVLWKELNRNNLPTYNKFCLTVKDALYESMNTFTCGYVSYLCVFLAYSLAYWGIGSFFTRFGRFCWHVVARKYFLFLSVCLGVWTEEAYIAYDIAATLKQYVSEDDVDENISKILGMIVGPRALMFMLIPKYGSAISVGVLAFSTVPLLLLGKHMPEIVPEFLIPNSREIAIEREMRVNNAPTLKNLEWIIYIRQINIFVMESRLPQFVNYALILGLSFIILVYSKHLSQYFVLVLFLLFPFVVIQSLLILVYFGKSIDLKDSDFRSFFSMQEPVEEPPPPPPEHYMRKPPVFVGCPAREKLEQHLTWYDQEYRDLESGKHMRKEESKHTAPDSDDDDDEEDPPLSSEKDNNSTNSSSKLSGTHWERLSIGSSANNDSKQREDSDDDSEDNNTTENTANIKSKFRDTHLTCETEYHNNDATSDDMSDPRKPKKQALNADGQTWFEAEYLEMGSPHSGRVMGEVYRRPEVDKIEEVRIPGTADWWEEVYFNLSGKYSHKGTVHQQEERKEEKEGEGEEEKEEAIEVVIEPSPSTDTQTIAPNEHSVASSDSSGSGDSESENRGFVGGLLHSFKSLFSIYGTQSESYSDDDEEEEEEKENEMETSTSNVVQPPEPPTPVEIEWYEAAFLEEFGPQPQYSRRQSDYSASGKQEAPRDNNNNNSNGSSNSNKRMSNKRLSSSKSSDKHKDNQSDTKSDSSALNITDIYSNEANDGAKSSSLGSPRRSVSEMMMRTASSRSMNISTVNGGENRDSQA
eukprot:gene24040-30337_t